MEVVFAWSGVIYKNVTGWKSGLWNGGGVWSVIYKEVTGWKSGLWNGGGVWSGVIYKEVTRRGKVIFEMVVVLWSGVNYKEVIRRGKVIFEMVVVLWSGVIYEEVTRKKWSLKWWWYFGQKLFTRKLPGKNGGAAWSGVSLQATADRTLTIICSCSLTLNKLRQQRALEERLNQKRSQQMSKLQSQQQTEVVVSKIDCSAVSIGCA